MSQKLKHSIMLALLFFVVSSPWTYKLVDSIVSVVLGNTFPQLHDLLKIADAGCPRTYGLFVHAVVFGLVSYFLLH